MTTIQKPTKTWSLQICGLTPELLNSPVHSHSSSKIIHSMRSLEKPQIYISAAWDAFYCYLEFEDESWTYSEGRWKKQVESVQKQIPEDPITNVFEIGQEIIYKTKKNRTVSCCPEGEVTELDSGPSKCIKTACRVADMHCLLYHDGSLHLPPVNSPLPGKPLALSWPVKEVSCGSDHLLILEEGIGRVWSLGLNLRGQLGHGDLAKRSEPCIIEALDGMKVKAISCGHWHNLVLSEFGDLYSWGWNADKQLGHSHSMATMSVPSLVEVADWEFCAVGCGSRHSAALTSCGRVLTWGWNGYGQLGHGDDTGRPAELSLPDNNTSISLMSCGPWNTFFMTNNSN